MHVNKKSLGIIILLFVVVIIATVFVCKRENIANQGISVDNFLGGEEISSPLTIKGKISGNGWTAFEGQAGTVYLLNGNGEKIASGILTATSEWTALPVSFEAVLGFDSVQSENGSLVFHNENPSGDPVKDKTFTLPVNINASGESTTVKVYFNNSVLDPEISCNKVFAVERKIPKTQAVARAALEELLKGPTEAEKNQGFSTSINPGVEIQKLTIEDGVARVDFNEQLEFGVGGSCRVAAISWEIMETLKQFNTVKSVVISINGRTGDILQP